MRIIWRRAATRDYASIHEYIEERSPSRAESTARRTVASVQSLLQFPQRGRPGNAEETRELVVARTPYVVIYKVEGEDIVILRVLHGAQRWPE